MKGPFYIDNIFLDLSKNVWKGNWKSEFLDWKRALFKFHFAAEKAEKSLILGLKKSTFKVPKKLDFGWKWQHKLALSNK